MKISSVIFAETGLEVYSFAFVTNVKKSLHINTYMLGLFD